MAKMKKAQAGLRVKFDEKAYIAENRRKLDSTNKEFDKRTKAISEKEKTKSKNSYSNQRATKVIGKNLKKGGKVASKKK